MYPHDIEFDLELFLTGPSYMGAGGLSGKAVPYQYIVGLADRVLAHLRERYPAYYWELVAGKWGTRVVGSPKEMPDPTDAVIAEVRAMLGGDLTLEQADALGPSPTIGARKE